MRKTLLLLLLGITTITTTLSAQNSLQKVSATDREEDAWFGEHVAISGDYAIIGARWENGYEGACYIFEKKDNDEFIEVAKLTASIPLAGAYFGCSVSIDGDYAVVGAFGESFDAVGANNMTEAGAAYIFARDDGGSWNEIQKIVASDRNYVASFGWDVYISGEDIIVGAVYEKMDESGNNLIEGAGAAYIFSKDGDFWVEKAKIVASDRGTDDQFGREVCINGDHAIVGVPFEDEDVNGQNYLSKSGSAYAYHRDNNGNWSQTQKIVAPERNGFVQFGSAVGISGDYMAIGANFTDKLGSAKEDMIGAGAVYMYELAGNNLWENYQEIFASDAYHYDEFGHSLSINNDHLLVGAYSEDDYENGVGDLFNAGAAYYYKRNGSGTWANEQKIIAPVRAEYDYFGYDVGIGGDGMAVIGAYGEDEDANGQNTLMEAGAAYFWIPGTSSITSIDFPGEVKVFPNPVINSVQVHIEGNHNINVALLHSSGKTIQSFMKTNANGFELDLEELPGGLYILEIHSEKYFSTLKLIKGGR